MITGIKSTTKFRGLSDNVMNGVNFGQTSIIFGRNGSGKTSITEAIRLADDAQTNTSSTDLIFDKKLDKRNAKIFVYNRFYVKENLESFIDASAGAGSIALGSKAISDKKEKKQVQDDLSSAQDELDQINEAAKNARTEKTVGEAAKTRLITMLGDHEHRFHSTLLKNDRKFQTRILQSKNFEESEQSSEELLRNIIGDRPKEHRLKSLSDIAIPVDLDTIQDTLSRSPENSVANRISGDSELIDWIFQGFKNFTHESECPFCTQEIPSDRIHSLKATFNNEHSQIKSSCTKIKISLRAAKEILTKSLDAIKSSYFPDRELNEKFEIERDRLVVILESKSLDLDNLIQLVSSKEADPSNVVRTPVIDLRDVSLQMVRDLQRQYDELVQGFETLRSQSILELEKRIISEFSDEMASVIEETKAHAATAKETETRIAQLQERLDRIIASESDTSEMAKQISNVLRLHLGREDLQVSSTGTDYRILRHGIPAEFLSDGERNIIAFIYFLKSIDDIKFENTKKIVVIDDPVNSMDGENSASCVSLISEERKKWVQTILLTHNFDFLKSSMRALGTDGQTENEITLLHTTPTWDNSENKMRWSLEPMPETLRLFSSEYHYLFWSVAAAASGQLDSHHFMALGNVARRLLEAFLSYKRPATPDLRQSVESAWAKTQFAEELQPLASRTLAVLNNSSHEQSPTPSSTRWTLLNETDFRALLYTMNHIDSDHFEQMVRATKFDQPNVSGDFIRAMRPYKRVMGALEHGQKANIQNLLP